MSAPPLPSSLLLLPAPALDPRPLDCSSSPLPPSCVSCSEWLSSNVLYISMKPLKMHQSP
ncbi:hypothetical protein PF010_g25435 [Phytophthora fragariae]|uniref:Uncharacterized protein n=1 Tax=Phytophthora fragariae TaxID=53985 RepID=A0A6A3HXN9_9STRA|nr:hypothetical protein PF009_g23355 [Phytophthora fragariae]KAE8974187.1 hypothetical protein PF011_g24959 [Phytophthora fragariae]KAE9072559.1 hypothetical protein PF010_g25435 [Phytophthora fragariae]KAE9072561.1 hypothetical protein PF007_g26132 [Phytophthora fragariae]KAE9090316.1 hypothetical protein PF006_g25187 [Phytophthora fragariae]